MVFRWNQWNVEHIAGHGVEPAEAEAVVSGASEPFPLYRGDGKWLVWGRGRGRRYLQVVFVLDEDDSRLKFDPTGVKFCVDQWTIGRLNFDE